MRTLFAAAAIVAAIACKTTGTQQSGSEKGAEGPSTGQALLIEDNAKRMIAQGRDVFRDETFGSEDFYGGALKLHQAIAGEKNGGVGGGVSPKTALSVGLKVDAERVPGPVASGIKSGAVSLDDPANTLALLKANAVVGVRGVFDGDKLSSLGITCAFCHSTVDDTFAPGIGKRLDGWPNRDLNVGAIVSLAPDLSPITSLLQVDEATVKKVLGSWGPGKFDAELNLDGKGFRPDGKTAATLLPAAFGLAGVNLHTYSGWGSVTYWNAYVANNEMYGKGVFFDPRLDDREKFPVAARAGFGHRKSADDRISAKLASLQFYQLSIPAPAPPQGSFDASAAARGKALFEGKAKCATCHVPPLYTEPGWGMHTAEEIGIDDFQAKRSPDGRYRTTPLRGLFARAKGGFYHDGRFANYAAVIDHYDGVLRLGLEQGEKADLQEFLKSL
jgi:cytochrome c5